MSTRKTLKDVRHEKTDLKVFVVVIPKEGWARIFFWYDTDFLEYNYLNHSQGYRSWSPTKVHKNYFGIFCPFRYQIETFNIFKRSRCQVVYIQFWSYSAVSQKLMVLLFGIHPSPNRCQGSWSSWGGNYSLFFFFCQLNWSLNWSHCLNISLESELESEPEPTEFALLVICDGVHPKSNLCKKKKKKKTCAPWFSRLHACRTPQV